jgi:V/A-type H+/Na+-transporting ATPase subunit E
MKTEAQDIEMLARAILTEAREEADHMLAEAKEKAGAIGKRALDQAETEKRTILERANQDAERLRGQSVATAQLKARSTQLDHREKILDNAFEEARKQLGAVKKRQDYPAIAEMLLREALSQLRVNKAEIQADESTQKTLKNVLGEVSKELNGEFTLGETLDEGTGVVVIAADGKLRYDNTLETRLSRLQSTLRSSVYKVLMGENA